MRIASVLLAAAALAVLAGAACGNALTLTHTETACVYPGQTVTLHTHTQPGSTLKYTVQDDFGGVIGTIAAATADSNGDVTVIWKSPSRLSTTTLHFLLTARSGSLRASRDIHVIVGGNGRSC